MKKYISVLLATVLFVLGMLGGGTADAAKVTAEEVSRTVTIQPRAKKGEEKPTKTAQIKMHVMLENLDLKAYEKYTAELRRTGKYGHVVFAKAAPGSQISISAEADVIPGMFSKLSRGNNYSGTVNYYNHKKINNAKDLMPVGKVNGFENKYIIPKDVEEVTAYGSITYHVGMEVGNDMKSSTGTYRKEPALARHYYIFTSDAACKKAYKLLTGDSAAGSTGSIDSGTKKSAASEGNGKQTAGKDKASVSPEKDSGESGGFGTAGKVGIGVVAAGAIGFGASRLLKGRGSSKGGGGSVSGAGKAGQSAAATPKPERVVNTAPPAAAPRKPERFVQNDSPTAPSKPERFAHTATSAGANAAGKIGAKMDNAAGTTAFCKQCGAPLRSGSRFCAKCGARNAPEFCTNCGAKLEPDSMFCGNCGAKV